MNEGEPLFFIPSTLIQSLQIPRLFYGLGSIS
jgi:hypothetical protein